MTTFLWLLVVAGGPLLIALVLAYGMMRSRKLTGAEERDREDAIDALRAYRMGEAWIRRVEERRSELQEGGGA